MGRHLKRAADIGLAASIPDADIRNGDTLMEPKHIEDGRLMRFDRVILHNTNVSRK